MDVKDASDFVFKNMFSRTRTKCALPTEGRFSGAPIPFSLPSELQFTLEKLFLVLADPTPGAVFHDRVERLSTFCIIMLKQLKQ